MIPSSMATKRGGSGTSPKSGASGVLGRKIVAAAVASVVQERIAPGRLARNGRRVRMTSTMNSSVMRDSTNQPV